MTAKQEQVISIARSWSATPYVHQARGPKGPTGGTDCVGLLIGVATEMGLIEEGYDPTGYSWETDGTQLRAELNRWADMQAFADVPQPPEFWLQVMEPGDIAVFTVAGMPQHTGIITIIDYGISGMMPGLIHAYNPAKAVVEHNLDTRWFRRMTEIWRLR
jgi:cell wall-associated NlpC family hydrolase